MTFDLRDLLLPMLSGSIASRGAQARLQQLQSLALQSQQLFIFADFAQRVVRLTHHIQSSPRTAAAQLSHLCKRLVSVAALVGNCDTIIFVEQARSQLLHVLFKYRLLVLIFRQLKVIPRGVLFQSDVSMLSRGRSPSF